MNSLFDSSGKPIKPSEPNKNWWKRAINWYKVNPILKTFVGILPLLAFLGINNIGGIFKLYEKAFPKEIIFTDGSGYKVLLLRFQPYEDCSTLKTNIEIVIRDRLLAKSEEEELGLQVLLDTIQPWPRTYSDARKIGKRKGADLVIWGDLYEKCYSDPKASLSYIVMDSSYYEIKKKGKSAIEAIVSLANVREGQLQQDVEYVIYWTLVQKAVSRGECNKSKIYFTNISQIYPDKSGNNYYKLGFCYQKNRELRLAANYYDTAIQIDPKNAFAYNARGGVKYDLGDTTGALADYNKVIQINSHFSYAYFNRGNVKYDLGDIKGALADFDTTIQINPKNSDAYLNRGIARDDLGDVEGALADYNTAIQIDPQDAYAYINRGGIKYNLGDAEGALADYDIAIQIDPQDADSYYNRGI